MCQLCLARARDPSTSLPTNLSRIFTSGPRIDLLTHVIQIAEEAYPRSDIKDDLLNFAEACRQELAKEKAALEEAYYHWRCGITDEELIHDIIYRTKALCFHEATYQLRGIAHAKKDRRTGTENQRSKQHTLKAWYTGRGFGQEMSRIVLHGGRRQDRPLQIIKPERH